MLWFHHEAEDGRTVTELAIWSRVRRMWSPWRKGEAFSWSRSLREAFLDRMAPAYLTDSDALMAEDALGDDPWAWLLAAQVMGA